VRRWSIAPLVTAALLTAALAGCGGSSSAGKSAKPETSPATLAAVPPEPAGVNPSESAKMICGSAVKTDLQGVLGVDPTAVTTPTWADHVYSCTYQYPDGAFTLSVKELSSARETSDYFDQLGAQLGRKRPVIAVGEDTFMTSNGSLVARKDWKVLLVDVSGLPDQFAKPPTERADVAAEIGTTVMGCWTGA